jgi:hypothetical protein
MRCLFVISGESFRSGGQFSRKRSDDKHTINLQRLASYSHIRLINYVKKAFNINTDILINTYAFTPKCDELLLKLYEPRVIYANFRTSQAFEAQEFHSQTNAFVSNLDLELYEFIFFIRIDHYIKKYFLSKFKKIDDKIRYGLLDYNSLGAMNDLVYIPKCYFKLINVDIYQNIRNVHGGGQYLVNSVGIYAIDYFINTYHSLSTDYNWNPIFTNVERPESLNNECRGQRYINYKKVFVENDNEYDHLIGTDTIEENIKLLEEGKFDMIYE